MQRAFFGKVPAGTSASRSSGFLDCTSLQESLKGGAVARRGYCIRIDTGQIFGVSYHGRRTVPQRELNVRLL